MSSRDEFPGADVPPENLSAGVSPGPGEVGSAARAEIAEYLDAKVVRRRLFPRALAVGIVSGLLAVLFRLTLEGAEFGRQRLVALAGGNPALQALLVLLVATAGAFVALVIGRLDADAGGSGIPHMKAVLEGHAGAKPLRLILVKFAGAVAAIGSGLALGREGPTVQMAGAASMGLGDLAGSSGRERRALVAAGAGAGLAAAFNAPLAGVTFVLEELQRDFQPVVFSAALLAAAVSTVVSRIASGQLPVFRLPAIEAPSLSAFPLFIVVGALGGLVGVLFNRTLLDLGARVAPLRRSKPWLVAGGTGLIAALAYLVSPYALGGGHRLTEMAVEGRVGLGIGLAILLSRFLFIQASYATGVPGGIFAPLLSLGALLGASVHGLSNLFHYAPLTVAACGVAGMCAVFSGVVRAPLTGVILIGEMTGSYALLLPLLVAAFTAYAVAELLGDVPIYEALLQRDALKRGWTLQEGEPLLREFAVAGGSAFEGRPLRDLRLPAGLVVVTVRENGVESVPHGATVLHAHARILVAATDASALRAFAAGVAAP